MYRTGNWPTRDGVIPYKLFFLLVEAAETIEAEEELWLSRGVSLGYAIARAGNTAAVKRVERSVQRRAYPEVTIS